MAKLIFLDFDGVLRRESSPRDQFDPDCLEHFESALRQCAQSKVIISSTWRLAMPLHDIRQRFSPDIAQRIVGKTPELLEEESFPRFAEVQAFLAERNVTRVPWLAIDDDREHFPPGAPVLFTDPAKGFDAECSAVLARELLG